MLHPTNVHAQSLDSAVRLMLEALVLLDKADAGFAACALQHAIDTVRGGLAGLRLSLLALCMPGVGFVDRGQQIVKVRGFVGSKCVGECFPHRAQVTMWLGALGGLFEVGHENPLKVST